MQKKHDLFNITTSIKGISFAGLAIAFFMISSLTATTRAQCGIALDDIAIAASMVRSDPKLPPSPLLREPVLDVDNSGGHTIVGFWHIRFMVAGNEIQEAFQIWNKGGTEVHNPRVDPRTSSICLGGWTAGPRRNYNLTHRVWLYDPNGNFQGTGFLTETVYLENRGTNQVGTFKLEIHDPSGTIVATIEGDVVGERVF